MRLIPEEAVILPVGVAERVVGDLREKFDPWDVPAHILLATYVPDDLEARLESIQPFAFQLTTAKLRPGMLVLEPDRLGAFYDLIEALDGSGDPELIVAVRDHTPALDAMRMLVKSALPIEAYASEVAVVRGTTIERSLPL